MAILTSPLDIASLNSGAHVPEVWPRILFYEAINSTFFSRLQGDGPDAIIQRVMDLSRSSGDTIHTALLGQIDTSSEFGVTGTAQLKSSQEQQLSYDHMSIVIDQKRQAVTHYRSSAQETVHDLRRDSMRVLRDFFATYMDRITAVQLCGTGGNNTTLETEAGVINATANADANHQLDNTGSAFDAGMIDTLKWNAVEADPPFRTVRVSGGEHYVLLLHPGQAKSLQSDSTTNTWFEAQSRAAPRSNENRIFEGSLGTWNGVVLHANAYMPEGPEGGSGSAAIKNGVLLGAQAGMVAFGKSYSMLDGVSRRTNTDNGFPIHWVEEVEDFGNEIGISAGLVMGIKKSRFDTAAEDYATYHVVTTDT